MNSNSNTASTTFPQEIIDKILICSGDLEAAMSCGTMFAANCVYNETVHGNHGWAKRDKVKLNFVYSKMGTGKLLEQAVKNGNLNTVKHLVETKDAKVNSKLITIACSKGNAGLIAFLAKKCQYSAAMAFFTECKLVRLHTARELMRYIDHNYLSWVSGSRGVPAAGDDLIAKNIDYTAHSIQLACKRNDLETVKYIHQRCNDEYVILDKWVLYAILERGHLELLGYLIQFDVGGLLSFGLHWKQPELTPLVYLNEFVNDLIGRCMYTAAKKVIERIVDKSILKYHRYIYNVAFVKYIVDQKIDIDPNSLYRRIMQMSLEAKEISQYMIQQNYKWKSFDLAIAYAIEADDLEMAQYCAKYIKGKPVMFSGRQYSKRIIEWIEQIGGQVLTSICPFATIFPGDYLYLSFGFMLSDTQTPSFNAG